MRKQWSSVIAGQKREALLRADDFTGGLGCLGRIVGLCKRGGQALDPAPKGFGGAGVDVGNVLRT